MKTIYFAFFCIVFLFQTNYSQSYLKKGMFQVSGSISYTSSTREYPYATVENEEFNLSPIISYFIIDNLSTGFEIAYNYYNHSEMDIYFYPEYHNTLSIGPSVRYYLFTDKIITPFLESGYNHIVIDLEEARESIKERGYKIRLGLGANYFISKSVAIEPSLYYEYKSTKRVWLIEGSLLERYFNEKNIIVGIKLNFFIN
ncbi:MAG: hypothetical protein PHW27_08560 [Melioribacteraceae bacterium]|nr:hypothetical protein [Melioribacteraceae bacterium]MDD3558611.1 hypothetical protein [Melioribacteraceae bacterium]